MATKAQERKNVKAFESMLDFVFNNKNIVAPLFETYSFAKVKPTAGTSYFVAECNHCNRSSPLFRDPTNGQMGNPFTGPGGFRAPCAFCPQEIRAGSQDVHSVEWT
jgi:hypothetical protein